MAHILADAAVLVVGGVAGAWWEARHLRRAAILARITPPDTLRTQAAVDQMDAAAGFAHRYLNTAGVEVQVETDEWGGRHYHLKAQPVAPVTAPYGGVLHLVDTQTLPAVTATRPILPAVPAAGKLARARFYDIGRAG